MLKSLISTLIKSRHFYLFRTDENGIVLDNNELAEGLFTGSEAEELFSLFDIFPDNIRVQLVEALRQKKESIHFTDLPLKSRIEKFAFEILPYKNGSREEWVWIGTKTISESAQIALEITEGGISAGMYQFVRYRSGEVEFTYANDYFFEILNISKRELRKDTGSAFKNLHPDDRYIFEKSVAECYSSRKDWDLQFRIQQSNGTYIWIKGSAKVQFDTLGNLVWNGLLLESDQEMKQALLLREVSEFARVGAYEVNLLTGMPNWTNAVKAIFDLPFDYQPNLEEALLFYKEGEDRDTVIQVVTDAIEKGKSFEFEQRIITQNGVEKWVHAIGRVEFNKEVPVRLFGVIRDIDKRKRAELETEKKSDLLEKIFAQSSDVFCSINTAGEFLWISPSSMKNFGFLPEEMMGKSFMAFIHPEDVQKSIQVAGNLFNGGGELVNFKNRYFHKNGEIVHIWWNAQYDKQSGTVFAFGRNMTELVESEKAIHRHHLNTENLIQGISSAFFLFDEEDKLILFNDNSRKLLSDLNIEFDEHTENIDSIFQKELNFCLSIIQSLKQKKNHTAIEILLQETGEWYEVKFYYIKNNIAVFFTNISSRKRYERERESLLSDLVTTNRELKQFSYITSHNLRGPLTNFQGLISLLKQPSISSDERMELLEYLETTAENLASTIEDLNSILILKEQKPNTLQEVFIQDFFHELMNKVLGSQYPPVDVSWSINTEKINCIKFNTIYLESIFSNLISNSVKYRRTDIPLKISVECKKVPSGVEILFSDNGIGLDMARYSDRFFGLYQRFNVEFSGKGLGLFMTKTQMEALGGSIQAESRPMQGMTFTLFFPN